MGDLTEKRMEYKKTQDRLADNVISLIQIHTKDCKTTLDTGVCDHLRAVKRNIAGIATLASLSGSLNSVEANEADEADEADQLVARDTRSDERSDPGHDDVWTYSEHHWVPGGWDYPAMTLRDNRDGSFYLVPSDGCDVASYHYGADEIKALAHMLKTFTSPITTPPYTPSTSPMGDTALLNTPILVDTYKECRAKGMDHKRAMEYIKNLKNIMGDSI